MTKAPWTPNQTAADVAAHKARHQDGGADEISIAGLDGTPAELTTHAAAADPHTGYQRESEKGAANGYASLGVGGLVPIAQLASGTADGTKYVRDDGTLVTPTGGASEATVIKWGLIFGG